MPPLASPASDIPDLEPLLNPQQFFATSVIRAPSPVPRGPGVYGWYFDEVPPGVPTEGCHQASGYTLLYVGIAPKKPGAKATTVAPRTLHSRLTDHCSGNAEGSTLRLTLGCLLADQLGITLRRVGSGKRYTFTNPGEIALDRWMASHACVVWLPTEHPWEVEHGLIQSLSLPLNLQGNQHPFVPTLKDLRRAAKAQARALPIVSDNGGPRREPTMSARADG